MRTEFDIYDQVSRAGQAPKFYLWGLGPGAKSAGQKILSGELCEFIRRPHSSINSLALKPLLCASNLIFSQAVGVNTTVLFALTSSCNTGIFFNLFCPFLVVIFRYAVYTGYSIDNKGR
jgi:hypothetical protein